MIHCVKHNPFPPFYTFKNYDFQFRFVIAFVSSLSQAALVTESPSTKPFAPDCPRPSCPTSCPSGMGCYISDTGKKTKTAVYRSISMLVFADCPIYESICLPKVKDMSDEVCPRGYAKVVVNLLRSRKTFFNCKPMKH